MFFTNVLVNDHILDRAVFDNIKDASKYAVEKSREKVWKLDDNSVFYGNVESRVYEIDFEKPSDYRDEHILSFFGSVWERTHELRSTRGQDTTRNMSNVIHGVVLFGWEGLRIWKRAVQQRWNSAWVSPRACETPHDHVGGVVSRKLFVCLWDRHGAHFGIHKPVR